MSGKASALTHLATACRETPSVSERPSCVIPRGPQRFQFFVEIHFFILTSFLAKENRMEVALLQICGFGIFRQVLKAKSLAHGLYARLERGRIYLSVTSNLSELELYESERVSPIVLFAL